MLDLFKIDQMLAGKSAPLTQEGWIFELKYDGYRVLASNGQIVTRVRIPLKMTDCSAGT